jgi:hypothetical protein
MTSARNSIVNYAETKWFHCISRIARSLPSLQSNNGLTKNWLVNRIRELSEIFAIRVGGHAIMGTHFHLLLRVETEEAAELTAVEVARRWAKVCPPKDRKRRILRDEELEFWVDEMAKDKNWVESRRQRLQDLGWFHKFLKQPLAALVNKLEGKSGTLFQGRYKSIAVIGMRALLNVCIYIDLNPVAAGIVSLPEQGEHTSFRLRFENAIKCSGLPGLVDDFVKCKINPENSAYAEHNLWLLAIENPTLCGNSKIGMFDDLTLIQYFLLVDEAGRVPRAGKVSISKEVIAILERLGLDHQTWTLQQQALAEGKFRGHYLATSKVDLARIAARRGVKNIINLNNCPLCKTEESTD